jgi:peptidoglycan/xylan/chitin deacetylase (PgdA/CDA1 family)
VGKYGTLGSAFDRIFRNTLNKALDDVDTDINAQKKRVDDLITGTPQPSEVVDARGGFPVLSGRLDDLSSSVAQSMTKEQENVNFALKKNTQSLAPLITFIDDDGKLATYEKIYPLFQSKGKKFVSAISSGLMGNSGYMTKTQIDEVYNAGHEIASHGVNHNWATTHPQETKQSYDQLNAFGYKTENMVYVGGDFNNSTILDVKKYYNSAVAVGGGTNIAPVRTFALKRVPLGSFLGGTADGIAQDGSYSSYKSAVDYAIANNGWLIFMLHSWHTDHNATQQQYLSDLLDYIATTPAKIVTMKEGLSLYGNKVDIGDTANDHFLIGTDGSLKSSYLKNRLYSVFAENATTITNTTPYTFFPKGNIHVATIADNIVTGFPSSNGGTLETYNLKDLYYAFQRWYPYNSMDKFYYRKWKLDNSGWDEWKTIDTSPPISEIVQITGMAVNANSQVSVVVPTTLSALFNVNSNAIVASPRGGLEDGCVWSVEMATNKTVTLKIFNVTATNRTLATRYWHFKVIK